MQRNFGWNSGFTPVSAETEIREYLSQNYLNLRGFILPLLCGDRAGFGKTKKNAGCFLEPKQLPHFVKMVQNSKKISEC